MMMINARLKPLKKYAINLHYKMYLDNNLNQPYQEKTIEIRKDQSNLICKNSTVEFVSTSDFNLYIDHRNKKMMLLPEEKGGDKDEYLEFVNFIESNFDSIMYVYQKIDFKVLENNICEYQCFFKGGKYTRMDIRFSKKAEVITCVTFYYRNKIHVEKIDQKDHSLVMKVYYENFNLSPVFSAETFSPARYLVKKNKDTYIPSINYKGYEIYDKNSFQ